MDAMIWICQGVLAAIFLYSGCMKSTQSERWLVAHNQTGVEGLPLPLIRFIGVSEIFLVAGLVLPWALQIAPVLTPVAAVCCAIIMILAAPIHYKRKEPQSVMINVVVFLISVFVAWARLKSL